MSEQLTENQEKARSTMDFLHRLENSSVPDREPSGRDMWCAGVMRNIEEESLAMAGYELAKLVDFALKTQHGDHFNRQVRDCCHAYWNRCLREIAKGNAPFVDVSHLQARVAELQSLVDAYAQRVTDQDTEIAILRQREEER